MKSVDGVENSKAKEAEKKAKDQQDPQQEEQQTLLDKRQSV